MFSLESLRGNGFSWLAALSFAAASKLSYQDKMACAGVTHKWGFVNCDFLDVADTQGFIAQTDDLVMIAFRGTESLADWLADLTLLPAPWPTARYCPFGLSERLWRRARPNREQAGAAEHVPKEAVSDRA